MCEQRCDGILLIRATTAHSLRISQRNIRPAVAFQSSQPPAAENNRKPRKRSCTALVTSTNSPTAASKENKASSNSSTIRLLLLHRILRNKSYIIPHTIPASIAYNTAHSCSGSGLVVITGTACGKIRLHAPHCHHIPMNLPNRSA